MDTMWSCMGRLNERLHVNRAFLTMVALDADGRPTRVPMLALETDEERADFEAGKKRKEMRRRSRQ